MWMDIKAVRLIDIADTIWFS